MRLVANISLLFANLPLLERFEAAANAGFDGVELQFPYDENVVDIQTVSKIHSMPVILINIPAGDMDNGDAGLAALPDRKNEFLKAMEKCHEWSRILKVEKINVLAGRADGGLDSARIETLIENLATAGDRFNDINVAVQLEAINPFDMPEFLVPNLVTALEVLKATNHPNVHLQFDFYHMARTEPSLIEAIRIAGPEIGHVQFADTEGRHEPGTGNIDFTSAFQTLKNTGYNDTVSAEYLPHSNTSTGLAWMPKFRTYLKD